MYPVGTKCVITWTKPRSTARLGDIVTIGPRFFRAGWPQISSITGEYLERTLDRQQIDRTPTRGSCVTHPVAWMRPLEDPDIPEESITELVTAIKELADENNES